MMARERALLQAIRRALLMMVAALDTYLKETEDQRAA